MSFSLQKLNQEEDLTMRGAILKLKGILWSLWGTLTRRNVILKSVIYLLAPPIYSLLCKGYSNEDFRYAFLLLAMEAVSFTLDLLGGSHWGYLLASALLSALILETTIYAYFIKRSRIKSEAQQLCAVEIVFSVLQLIISCYCLIKTLSGVKTNYGSSVFPLVYAIISVVFTFISKNDVSPSSWHPPPEDPSNQSVSIPMPTDDAEARPLDKTLDSVPTSDAKEDASDKSPVPVPSTSARVPQANTLRQRRKQSHFQVDPLNPTLDSAPTSSSLVFNLKSTKDVSHSSVDTPPDSPSNQFVLVSAPTSDAEVDPWDEPLVSVPTSGAEVDPLDEPHVALPTSDAEILVPTSDAEIDPLDEPLVSVPTSDAQVDPLDEPLVSVPSSDASVPQADTLHQRSKQSHCQKLVLEVDLHDGKAKNKAMRTVCGISGVESVQMDMMDKKLRVIGDFDPVDVVSKLRKQCHSEIISVRLREQPKTSEEKQSVEKKNFEEYSHPPRPVEPVEFPADCVIC